MAKLSAHGTELGRIAYLTFSKAYFSDRTVLINHGGGWKIHGKLKAGLDAQTAYENATAKMKVELLSKPCLAAYKKELHSIAGQNTRARLHMAIGMMPDDCDGVWSECCDGYGDNVQADVDEIGELCRLYRCAIAEKKEQSQIAEKMPA